MDAHFGQAPDAASRPPGGEAGGKRVSALADPKERALFVILTEHDVNVWTRGQVGPIYVGCPTCGAASYTSCIPTTPNFPSYHAAREELRSRTLPDLSDIHTQTRKRIRDLLEHDVYPEDLLT
jgi:hypothetical protein